MNTIVNDTLFAPIQIQQNGKTTTVPALEAILLKMRNNALSGDFRSAAHAIQLASRSADLEEAGHLGLEVSHLDPSMIVEMMRDYLDHKASPADNSEGDGRHGPADREDEE